MPLPVRKRKRCVAWGISLTRAIVISVICAALASYNAFELILLIFTTFHKYHGLYFWSMVTATCGIFPYVVGMEIMYFDQTFTANTVALVINNLGWISMVTAQSVVLYSRLGIVLGNPNSRILVFTKWMIIIDSFVFYTLATTIVFGMHYSTNHNFDKGYIYIERLQMTGFCIQEFVISGLYIWKTLDIMQAGEKKQAHRTLWQLFIINVVIVALDVALLVLEYLGLASIQIAFKALAYAVKLKMEFAILSKLVESSSLAQRNLSVSLSSAIVLEDDRPAYSKGATPSSPQFVTSALSQWRRDEKIHCTDYAGHCSHESIRTMSHQTDGSETHLFGPALTTMRSTTSGRGGSNPYHDMIRAIPVDRA